MRLTGHGIGFESEGFTKLVPDFQTALRSLIEASGGKLFIVSGYRSVERQTQLWNDAVRKYGSEAAARKWVAPPGKSHHNHGTAADLRGDLEWAHQNAGRFGLKFPMSWEPWHIELGNVPHDADGQTTPPNAVEMPNELKTLDGQVQNLAAIMGVTPQFPGVSFKPEPQSVPVAQQAQGQGGSVTGTGIQAVVQAARAAGFSGDALITAVAVAMAESGGVPQKSKYPGEESYGMWQVHLPSHPEYTSEQMMDPAQNAQAAFKISGGGANWKPWSVYKSGAYQQYLDDARAAVGV